MHIAGFKIDDSISPAIKGIGTKCIPVSTHILKRYQIPHFFDLIGYSLVLRKKSSFKSQQRVLSHYAIFKLVK